jgi:hypothetical protein
VSVVHWPYRAICQVLDTAVVVMQIADGRRDMRQLLERRLLGWRSGQVPFKTGSLHAKSSDFHPLGRANCSFLQRFAPGLQRHYSPITVPSTAP